MFSIKNKKRSIDTRISLQFIAGYVVVFILTACALYTYFREHTMEEYKRMAYGVTNLMSKMVDPDKKDEYLEQNFSSDEYNKIVSELRELRDCYPDVLYLYVYDIKEDGCHVVFDVDELNYDLPGDIYILDKEFIPYKDKLCRGEHVPPLAGNMGDDGYLLSYMRPMFDSHGNYAFHVCVDFSIDKMLQRDIQFVIQFMTLFAVIIMLIIIVVINDIKEKITMPIIRMTNCIDSFDYNSTDSRLEYINRIENLNITSEDEIGTLYKSLVATMKEAFYYMTNLNKTKEELSITEEKAMKDALTGVGSKIAYMDKLNSINMEITNKKVEQSVIVIDINNLKYINDTFGHDKGDNYIKGCCRMICREFSKSPVYRVGGDEFVVIPTGADYSDRYLRFEDLINQFEATYRNQTTDKSMRYSASCGIADYIEADDVIENTIKRADKMMYDNKQQFRSVYGKYR